MYGAIFGFHRRVLWPKWTPASSSWRIVNDGKAMDSLLFRFDRRGHRPARLKEDGTRDTGATREWEEPRRVPACEMGALDKGAWSAMQAKPPTRT